MAPRFQITCVSKFDRDNPYDRITHIGGTSGVNGPDGSWKITQSDAIAGIESGRWAFYVTRGGRIVDVVVSISPYGNKYIKTTADGWIPDNLLSLPDCS